MADVYTYNTSTGYVVPDTADIQAEVQAEYTNTFGSDLDVTSPSTPQGLLINAETQSRIAVADNNAALANQINPFFAGGIFLDAILALMGSQRIPATSSQVLCTITGTPGLAIPSGSLAQDVNGNQWQLADNVVLPLTGQLTDVIFIAVVAGPITVLANQLTTIISNILGWNSITNPAANYILGANSQSDVQTRQFRINTLYLQSNGLAGSIISALTALKDVQSLSFIENPSTATTIDNVAMNANSIYVCINGGDSNSIAAALSSTKSAGCAYTNGASQTPISFPYQIPISGQTINVLFDRPDIIQIGVQMTVVLLTPIQNAQLALTLAITQWAAGFVDGMPGLVVGGNVSPFEIAASIGAQYPGTYITNLLITNLTPVIMNGTTGSGTNIVNGLTNATIELAVGMSVVGAGIPVGTTITSITNNTTIVISQNATASATVSLTFSGNPQPQQITIQKWQLAAIDASNITVTVA